MSKHSLDLPCCTFFFFSKQLSCPIRSTATVSTIFCRPDIFPPRHLYSRHCQSTIDTLLIPSTFGNFFPALYHFNSFPFPVSCLIPALVSLIQYLCSPCQECYPLIWYQQSLFCQRIRLDKDILMLTWWRTALEAVENKYQNSFAFLPSPAPAPTPAKLDITILCWQFLPNISAICTIHIK